MFVYVPIVHMLTDESATQTPKLTFPHRNSVTALAFSPVGNMLVTAEVEKRVWLWDTITGACLKSLDRGI